MVVQVTTLVQMQGQDSTLEAQEDQDTIQDQEVVGKGNSQETKLNSVQK